MIIKALDVFQFYLEMESTLQDAALCTLITNQTNLEFTSSISEKSSKNVRNFQIFKWSFLFSSELNILSQRGNSFRMWTVPEDSHLTGSGFHLKKIPYKLPRVSSIIYNMQ